MAIVIWSVPTVHLYRCKNSSMRLMHIFQNENFTKPQLRLWLREWLSSELLREDCWHGSRTRLRHQWPTWTCYWRELTNKCCHPVIVWRLRQMMNWNLVVILVALSGKNKLNVFKTFTISFHAKVTPVTGKTKFKHQQRWLWKTGVCSQSGGSHWSGTGKH